MAGLHFHCDRETVTLDTRSSDFPTIPASAYQVKIIKPGFNPHTQNGIVVDTNICEKLPNGGGVRHMEVVYAAPGKALVMSGELGPMQVMAAAGGGIITRRHGSVCAKGGRGSDGTNRPL